LCASLNLLSEIEVNSMRTMKSLDLAFRDLKCPLGNLSLRKRIGECQQKYFLTQSLIICFLLYSLIDVSVVMKYVYIITWNL